MRIGIFGGTFNPPHKAHLNIAREFYLQVKLDKLVIIPTYTPPHKIAPDLAPSEDRLEMCRLLFEGDDFDVSDREIVRRGKSYTVDTLGDFCAEYPESEIFLLIGTDMLYSFDKWFRYRDILKMCTLCVAAREENDDRKDMLRYAFEVLRLDEEKIKILDIPALVISSTTVRSLSEKEREHMLTKEVNDYIKEHGLYEKL